MEQSISDSTIPTIELKTKMKVFHTKSQQKQTTLPCIYSSNPSVSETLVILPRSIMSYSYNIHIRHHPLRAGSSVYRLRVSLVLKVVLIAKQGVWLRARELRVSDHSCVLRVAPCQVRHRVNHLRMCNLVWVLWVARSQVHDVLERVCASDKVGLDGSPLTTPLRLP